MNIDVKESCEQLESNDRRVKTAALQKLTEQCSSFDTALRLDALAVQFDGLYLYLLKCYADRFESVRDSAVQTVSAFLEQLPPTDFHLMNVVATLDERMGQSETVEPSEELRLLYIGQLHLLVGKYAAMKNVEAFRECYPQVMRILIKSIKDAYPAVQREACATLVQLARAAGRQELQPFAEPLALALYGMLNHKHAPARIAAVEALAQVSLHISAKGEALQRLIMEVSPLLMDVMPLVRRECGKMGVLMLLELLDRYSYFERILPLVLCALKDSSPEVVDHIKPQWVKCGKLYYEENEAELAKQALADPPADNYPPNVERPTLGCRALVQRSLRLLKSIARETGDWKPNVRLHSLKLMYQFVLHAEAAMTAKFYEIYPELAASCCDPEPANSAEAKRVADLLGRLLKYDDWIDHGFDGLERNAREGYLKCFYYMFNAASGATIEQLLRLAKLLRTTDYSHSLKNNFQVYMLKMLDSLLDKSMHVTASEDLLQELYDNIYVGCIKVSALLLSLSSENSAYVNQGQMLLLRLAKLKNCNVGDLHELLLPQALEDVENLDASLEDTAEPVLLLDGLINLCRLRVSYLKKLITMVQTVFSHCNDSAKVRIFSSLSVASLSWWETIKDDDNDCLRSFIDGIVEPNLLWQAGSSAEAMRSLATATFCALAQSQNGNEKLHSLLPQLAKHMPSLLEDRNVSTRHYAVKAACHFQHLSVEDMKPLAYAVLQRVDDPSGGIRLMAAKTVGLLEPAFKNKEEDGAEFEMDVWKSFIKRVMDMMLLHYESPEKEMQLVAQSTLKNVAHSYPDAWLERYKRALQMVHNKSQLKKLYDEIGISEIEIPKEKLTIEEITDEPTVSKEAIGDHSEDKDQLESSPSILELEEKCRKLQLSE